MTAVTKSAQAYLAQLLYSKRDSMYIGLGRTTAWEDENTPPAEDQRALQLEEPICYTKAINVYLCKQVTNKTDSTVQYGDNYYLPVLPDKLDQEAQYIYCATKFTAQNIKVGISNSNGEIGFRQVGLFSGFKPKDNVTKTVISPANVDTLGTMLSVTNIKLVNITQTSPATVGVLYSIKPIIS